MKCLFYRPETGVSGDYIPFYEDGTFYLFYLRDFRIGGPFGQGTPWYLLSTKDFVDFTEHGVAVPCEADDAQDKYIFTGSVSKYAGQYHIWYTGHNPSYPEKGEPMQKVMHAVSGDLLHWEKRPEDTFAAPADRYEPDDWRDPFVYYDEEKARYHMLLAARVREGASRRRGVTALCTSTDGLHWKVEPPFYAPDAYYTHECPDWFKWGEWYYLLFSEFSSDKVTRYRVSKAPDGPWITPKDDRFDTCAWYAAKTASDGEKRFLFGWLATKEGEKDDGAWQWGGCLITHELVQREDGTLRIKLPDGVRASLPASKEVFSGDLRGAQRTDVRTLGVLKDVCAIEAEIAPADRNGSVSVALFCDEALEEGTFLRFEFNRYRVVVDRWPREAHVTHEAGLERPLPESADGKARLTLLMDGSALCAYINDEIALSFRVYNREKRHWGVLAEGVDAEVRAWERMPEE